jgi:hypothetical protein
VDLRHVRQIQFDRHAQQFAYFPGLHGYSIGRYKKQSGCVAVSLLGSAGKNGGYPGDTQSINNGGGISPGRPESEQAYNTLGIATPHPAGFSNFYTWLSSMPHSRCFALTGGIKCQMPIFENVPLEGGTDITAHVHVADQCVAKALAGVSGGCP